MPPSSVTGWLQEALTLVWLLLIATVVLTYFIQRYKVTAIPPSSAAMTLGILCGGVVKLAGTTLYVPERKQQATFTFQLLLLPLLTVNLRLISLNVAGMM